MPGGRTLSFKRILLILVCISRSCKGEQHIYSARVGLGYRALGILRGPRIIWYWIGAHSEYDRLAQDFPGTGLSVGSRRNVYSRLFEILRRVSTAETENIH